MISIDFNSQILFPLFYGVWNFGKVGVGYFTLDSTTLGAVLSSKPEVLRVFWPLQGCKVRVHFTTQRESSLVMERRNVANFQLNGHLTKLQVSRKEAESRS